METERAASAAGPMEKKRGSSHQYGSLERTEWSKDTGEPGEPPTLQWFDVGFVFFKSYFYICSFAVGEPGEVNCLSVK